MEIQQKKEELQDLKELLYKETPVKVLVNKLSLLSTACKTPYPHERSNISNNSIRKNLIFENSTKKTVKKVSKKRKKTEKKVKRRIVDIDRRLENLKCNLALQKDF